MAIDLKTPNGIPSEGKYTKMLENVQGNTLKAFNRKNMRLLFLQFSGDDDEVKAWIQSLSITSTMDQLVASKHRAIAAENNLPKPDGGLVMNFFMSGFGYEQLGYDVRALGKIPGNKNFERGMKSGRVQRQLRDPEISTWGEYNTDIDALLLLADDNLERLESKTQEIIDHIMDHQIAVVAAKEEGATLPNDIEHFGFKDGISNPKYLTNDLETKVGNQEAFDNWNPTQPLDIILVEDPFANRQEDNYGSFFVYRKLEQNVQGFNDKIKEFSEKIELTEEQKEKDVSKKELLEGYVVGRYKDGTPLALNACPVHHQPNDSAAENNFVYSNTDPNGNKCPFHAHIRKTNPRGQGIAPIRLITRRGIPYGSQEGDDKKGLLFMCFQSNIRDQFNFIQRTWSNNSNFQRLGTGIDALTGVGGDLKQKWPATYGSNKNVKFHFSDFVTMKGGEYFFAPSIGFLKNINGGNTPMA